MQTKVNTLSLCCGICAKCNKRSPTFWVDLSSAADCYTPLSPNFCKAVHAKEAVPTPLTKFQDFEDFSKTYR